MDSMMERLFSSIKRRASVRKFSASPVRDEFYDMKDFADEISNDDVRIALLSQPEVFKGTIFSKSVTGTKTCAVIVAKEEEMIKAGYIGEVFALECVHRGLGTCWLGSTYKKSVVKQNVNLMHNERIACVIAFGQCPGSMFSANSDEKKTCEELTKMSEKQFASLPEWQRTSVECMRLAPSALNKQECRVEFTENDEIVLYAVSDNSGYCEIDCGIAMLHLELGAGHEGVFGEWRITDEECIFIPYDE